MYAWLENNDREATGRTLHAHRAYATRRRGRAKRARANNLQGVSDNASCSGLLRHSCLAPRATLASFYYSAGDYWRAVPFDIVAARHHLAGRRALWLRRQFCDTTGRIIDLAFYRASTRSSAASSATCHRTALKHMNRFYQTSRSIARTLFLRGQG